MEKINRLANSYAAFVLKEVKHRFTYEKSYEAMAASMERYRECEDKKTPSQIKKEIKLCRKYWGCYPMHYFRYDLYRRDKQLSEKELINYIPEFFFYRLFLPYHYDNKYSVLGDEKIITEQIFRSLNIRQPKALYKLIDNNIYNMDMKIQGVEDFMNDLELNKYNLIFVKPSDGGGGKGIYAFHRQDNGNYKTRLNEELNEEFLKKIGNKGNYIFQVSVTQDKRMSEIYPKSANTFRIATENKKGNVRILCATLRMGRNGNEVDNRSQGGLVLGLNVDTGRGMEAAGTARGEIVYKHPDTGFIFKDYEIPEWSKIKEFAIDSARKLPHFTYLGWDIALSEDGPLAIETNLTFSLDQYQAIFGGLREVFSIDNPEFYWRNRRRNAK